MIRIANHPFERPVFDATLTASRARRPATVRHEQRKARIPGYES